MKQTHARLASPRRALSARMNQVLAAYDLTVLHRAEATLVQISQVLDNRDESKTSS